MRKTQVALAALALVASTAALADVTAYGSVDAAIVNNSSGTAFAGAGNSGTTLFGFKGSEDLGSGLKAGFNLEAGVNASTGQLGNGGVLQSTSLFNRSANVSLSTEIVGVTLGTQISPFIVAGLAGTTAVGGNGAFVPALARLDGGSLAVISTNTGNAAGGRFDTKTGGFFIPNATSLNLSGGGLSASILYRLNGAGAAADGSEYTAASLSGSVANVNLALGYQNAKNVGGATNAAALTETQNTVVAANTSIAGIRLNAAYGNNRGTTKSTGYILGASMNLTGALSGGLTFADNNQAGIGRQTTLSLQYDLSKATYTYLNYSTFGTASGGAFASNDNGGLTAQKSLLAVGLAHSF